MQVYRKGIQNNITLMYLPASLTKFEQILPFFPLRKKTLWEKTETPTGPFPISFHLSFFSGEPLSRNCCLSFQWKIIFLLQMLHISIQKQYKRSLIYFIDMKLWCMYHYTFFSFYLIGFRRSLFISICFSLSILTVA